MMLRLVDHGDRCPRRGIPLVDIYLSKGGECWLWNGGVSLVFAESMAEWFAAQGVKIQREEASSDPSHSRNLFSEVK